MATHEHAGDVGTDQDCVECAYHRERLRIAAWIISKGDETEALLKLAASRCEGERAAWNRLFAVKTRVILHVFAEMIERNIMSIGPKQDQSQETP